MTAVSSELDWDFPEPKAGGGGMEFSGPMPATLKAIRPPKPAQEANDRGEFPLQSIFVWTIDGYEDYEQFSYINVEASSDRSNFYKVTLCLTGKKMDRRWRPRPSELVGKRCILMCEPSTAKPGYTHVAGYAPLPKLPPAATPRRTAVEPDDDEPFD